MRAGEGCGLLGAPPEEWRPTGVRAGEGCGNPPCWEHPPEEWLPPPLISPPPHTHPQGIPVKGKGIMKTFIYDGDLPDNNGAAAAGSLVPPAPGALLGASAAVGGGLVGGRSASMPSFAPISILASVAMVQVPEGEAVMDAFGSEEAALTEHGGLAMQEELPAQYLPPPGLLASHPPMHPPQPPQPGPGAHIPAGVAVRRGSSDEVGAGGGPL